jgi:hypothetical protein
MKHCYQDLVWDRRQKSDQRTVYVFRHFIEHLVAHVQEITVGVQLRLENLELFNPVAQENDRLTPATIHNQLTTSNTQALKYTKDSGIQQELVTVACSDAEISRRDWRRIGHEHQREWYPSENQIEAGSPTPSESLPEQSTGASGNE